MLYSCWISQIFFWSYTIKQKILPVSVRLMNFQQMTTGGANAFEYILTDIWHYTNAANHHHHHHHHVWIGGQTQICNGSGTLCAEVCKILRSLNKLHTHADNLADWRLHKWSSDIAHSRILMCWTDSQCIHQSMCHMTQSYRYNNKPGRNLPVHQADHSRNQHTCIKNVQKYWEFIWYFILHNGKNAFAWFHYVLLYLHKGFTFAWW